MEKIRGNKPIRVLINTYIDISQGNSLCNYLYLKLKWHVFCFIFHLFSPIKSENRKAEQVLLKGEGLHQWEAGGVKERG
jgi:hypothetical protein